MNNSLEIERKFLIASPPANLESYPYMEIVQGYVAIERDTAVRIRKKGKRFFLTVKKGEGLKRHETEISLDKSVFFQLWPLTEKRRVEKTRYEIPLESLRIELDRYKGDLAPLITAEVEFDTEEASKDFIPPPWFGEEITEDVRYANNNLARYGKP